jgi:hypothetical protein
MDNNIHQIWDYEHMSTNLSCTQEDALSISYTVTIEHLYIYEISVPTCIDKERVINRIPENKQKVVQ